MFRRNINLYFQCRSISQQETSVKRIASSETSIDFLRTERRYVPEDRTVEGDLKFSRLWIWRYIYVFCYPHSLVRRYCLAASVFPENGASQFFRNISFFLRFCTASYLVVIVCKRGTEFYWGRPNYSCSPGDQTQTVINLAPRPTWRTETHELVTDLSSLKYHCLYASYLV
jgi:hypothetical protein